MSYWPTGGVGWCAWGYVDRAVPAWPVAHVRCLLCPDPSPCRPTPRRRAAPGHFRLFFTQQLCMCAFIVCTRRAAGEEGGRAGARASSRGADEQAGGDRYQENAERSRSRKRSRSKDPDPDVAPSSRPTQQDDDEGRRRDRSRERDRDRDYDRARDSRWVGGAGWC